MTAWTHNDLQDDLANHLHAGGGKYIWTNITMGEAGAPRPDVLTMAIYSWVNTEFIAYECKVTVADFRADVVKGKWQKYLDFAQGVTFAAPAGLIPLDSVPKHCGLIERHDGMWRHRRRPTMAKITMTEKVMLKLLREPTHRPTIAYTDTKDPDRYWREQRLSRAEARIHQQARAKIGQRLGRHIADYLENRELALGLVERAQEDARKIVDEGHARLELTKNSVQASMDELAKAVGLEPGSSMFQITEAVRLAAARLSKTGEIVHLRKQIENIERAISSARPLSMAVQRQSKRSAR